LGSQVAANSIGNLIFGFEQAAPFVSES